jgi:hypothetical protein
MRSREKYQQPFNGLIKGLKKLIFSSSSLVALTVFALNRHVGLKILALGGHLILILDGFKQRFEDNLKAERFIFISFFKNHS